MKKTGNIIKMLALLVFMLQISAVNTFAASNSKKVNIPAPTVKYAVQSADKAITMTWEKVKKADGYSVEYKATNGKWLRKNTTKTSLTIKGLKNGKKYTLRVRAFRKIDGKKVYGAYSKKNKVKIEKQASAQSWGSYYCKVCGYGRWRSYGFWQVFSHIASSHPREVARNMWRYRTYAKRAIEIILALL